jgi:hypothetical protein
MIDEKKLKQMEAEKAPETVPAALEVELLLQEGAITWSPSLGTETAGVGSTLLESLEYIANIGAAVGRFDSEEGLL